MNSFGTTKTPFTSVVKTVAPKRPGLNRGIGYGTNSFKNQQDLIEAKERQQGQGAQINSQMDLLDALVESGSKKEPSKNGGKKKA